MADWIPYEGPRGGTGWQSTSTDEVAYQDEKPEGNGRFSPSAPDSPRASPAVIAWAAKKFKNPKHAKAFLNWFGDSKVVDENGEPLVVYHGTNVDFSEFDKGTVKSRFPFSIGFHFSSSTGQANAYADETGGNIKPVYIQAKNPLVLTTRHAAASMELDMNRAEIIHQLVEAMNSGNPYDSVIVHRKRGDEWDEINVVSFDPKQIKSSTGNRGTFDPDSPDIRMSWTAYDGPRGGTGWKNSETGEVAYQDEMPGDGRLSPDPSAMDSPRASPAVIAWAAKKFKNPKHAKAFTAWFGDSKVVDENGEPLMLFHGTKEEFQEFQRSRGGEFGSGMYFSERPDSARMFGDFQTGQTETRIISVYLNLKNPLITNDRNVPRGAGIKKLIKKGYDGVIGTTPNGEKQYVAFSPTQIKSQSNRGTWSGDDPKILMSWTAYDGPRGGTGWKNSETGEVAYQEEMPGDGRLSPDPSAPDAPRSSPTVIAWATKRFKNPRHARAFLSWFGDSDVVDDNGEPLMLFHGTNAPGGITDFRPNTHLGTSEAANDRYENLRDFSVDVVGRDPGSFSVVPVYVKMDNILEMPDLASLYQTERGEFITFEEAKDRLDEFYWESSEEQSIDRIHPAGWESETDLSEWLYVNDVIDQDEFWEVQSSPDKAMQLLADNGYGGIKYENAVEDAGSASWIVFDPTNIKSSSGNRGTFDPEKKQIGMSVDGPREGEVNAEGLVFRNHRWHRDDEESESVIRSNVGGGKDADEPKTKSKPQHQSEAFKAWAGTDNVIHDASPKAASQKISKQMGVLKREIARADKWMKLEGSLKDSLAQVDKHYKIFLEKVKDPLHVTVDEVNELMDMGIIPFLGKDGLESAKEIAKSTYQYHQNKFDVAMKELKELQSEYTGDKYKTGHPVVVQVFHGSPTGFEGEQFSEEMRGAHTGAGSAKLADFFSGTPETAAGYAGHGSIPHVGWTQLSGEEKDEVISTIKGFIAGEDDYGIPMRDVDMDEVVKYATENPEHIRDIAGEVTAFHTGWNQLVTGPDKPDDTNDDRDYDTTLATPSMFKVWAKFNNPKVNDQENESYREVTYRKQIEEARKEGHDGLIILNTRDPGMYDSRTWTHEQYDNVFAVFDPDVQVKSATGNLGTFYPDEPSMMMAIQPGTRKTKNGVEYVLRDHRWHRDDEASGEGIRGATTSEVEKSKSKMPSADTVVDSFREFFSGSTTRRELLGNFPILVGLDDSLFIIEGAFLSSDDISTDHYRAIQEWTKEKLGDGGTMSAQSLLFNLISTNRKSKRRKALDNARIEAKGANAVLLEPDKDVSDRMFVAHKSTQEPGKIQLTEYVTSRGEKIPSGHTNHDSMDEALKAATGMKDNAYWNEGDETFKVTWTDVSGKPMRFSLVELAIQPGTRKTEDGREYVLKDSRWHRADEGKSGSGGGGAETKADKPTRTRDIDRSLFRDGATINLGDLNDEQVADVEDLMRGVFGDPPLTRMNGIDIGDDVTDEDIPGLGLARGQAGSGKIKLNMESIRNDINTTADDVERNRTEHAATKKRMLKLIDDQLADDSITDEKRAQLTESKADWGASQRFGVHDELSGWDRAKATISHELGHIFEQQVSQSQFGRFMGNMDNADMQAVSDRAADHSGEMFAELMAARMTGAPIDIPEPLKRAFNDFVTDATNNPLGVLADRMEKRGTILEPTQFAAADPRISMAIQPGTRKTENGVEYVLKDSRWHRADPDEKKADDDRSEWRSVGESLNSESIANVPTTDELKAGLTSNKIGKIHANRSLDEGKEVGLRIDIPYFLATGDYAISVHDTDKRPVGKIIGYDSVAKLVGPVTFDSRELAAWNIKHKGKPKGTIAVVRGHLTQDRTIPDDIDSYTPVGYNPRKALFFYDKRTGREVLAGRDAISIGNSVFIKEPEYGDRNSGDRTSSHIGGTPVMSWALKKFEKSKYAKAFMKWFGGSKAVNENGEPILVHHVTTEDFDEFDPSKSAMGGVFWFTSDKASIESGETGAGLRPGKKQFVVDAYLSIQKMAGWDEYHKYGIGQLEDMGYDGIKLDDDYVVFNPTQIKSQSNRGTWSGDDPKILMAIQPGTRKTVRGVDYVLKSHRWHRADTDEEAVDDDYIDDDIIEDMQPLPELTEKTMEDSGWMETFDNNGKDVEVYSNPSRRDLLKMTSDHRKKGQQRRVRGFIDDNDAYFWDAWKAIHVEAASGVSNYSALKNKGILGFDIGINSRGEIEDLSFSDYSLIRTGSPFRHKSIFELQELFVNNPGIRPLLAETNSDGEKWEELLPVNNIELEFSSRPKVTSWALKRFKNPNHARAFLKWFGDSNIVDENGEPRILFHATRGDFEAFEFDDSTSRSWDNEGRTPTRTLVGDSGRAIWLGSDPGKLNAAHNVGRRGSSGEGVSIIPSYVRMENPLVISSTEELREARKGIAEGYEEFPLMITDESRGNLLDAGYDGVIFHAHSVFEEEDAGTEFVVLDRMNIKSPANRGSFDYDDVRLLMALDGPQEGDVNARGLVFHNHRWHREEDLEQTQEQTGQSSMEDVMEDEQVASLMDRDSGVWEGYTIREHTKMVFDQWDAVAGPMDELSKELDVDLDTLMPHVLALHDIGKPLALDEGDKSRQHEMTMPILDRMIRKLGHGDREVALAKALVGHDTFGQLLTDRIDVDEAADRLIGFANEAGVDPNAFARLQRKYYEADASSYPSLKREIFEEHEGGLRLTNPKADEVNRKVALKSWSEKKFGNPEHAENFLKWFGDSQMVDENGEPLMVYHGTARVFDEFSTDNPSDRVNRRELISLTPDPEFASSYAGKLVSGEYIPGGNVIPAYVSASNVADYRNPEHVEMLFRRKLDRWEKFLRGTNVNKERWGIQTEEKLLEKALEKANIDREHIEIGSWTQWENKEFLEDNGFDAVITKEYAGDFKDVNNIGVISSSQIKSPANRGTWSGDDPKILMAIQPGTRKTEDGVEYVLQDSRWHRAKEVPLEQSDASSLLDKRKETRRGDKVNDWANKKFKNPAHSKAFVKWFGDSKAVDDNGEPMMLFHGERPSGTKIGQDGEVFLSADPETASHYARVNRYGEVSKTEYGSVFPVYAKMENPVDLRPLGFETDVVTLNKHLKDIGVNYQFSEVLSFSGKKPVWLFFSKVRPGQRDKFYRSFRNTHDGMILHDDSSKYGKDETGLTFITFKGSQIKSPANRGTWSKDDPKILMSVDGPQDGDVDEDGLVFRNHRWHRDDPEGPSEKPGRKPGEFSNAQVKTKRRGTKKSMRGEYWLQGTSAQFADSEIGRGHESFALDGARQEIVSDSDFWELADGEFVDWDEFMSKQSEEFIEKLKDEEDQRRQDDRQMRLKGFPIKKAGEKWVERKLEALAEKHDVQYSTGHVSEVIDVWAAENDIDPLLWQAAADWSKDIRLFASYRNGWIRLEGNNVQMVGVSRRRMEDLASGLWDAYGEDVEGQSFDLEVITRESAEAFLNGTAASVDTTVYEGVPYSYLEGGPSELREFKRMAIEWQAFKGPRGGTGWQDPGNPSDIRYQVERPGEEEVGEEAQDVTNSIPWNRRHFTRQEWDQAPRGAGGGGRTDAEIWRDMKAERSAAKEQPKPSSATGDKAEADPVNWSSETWKKRGTGMVDWLKKYATKADRAMPQFIEAVSTQLVLSGGLPQPVFDKLEKVVHSILGPTDWSPSFYDDLLETVNPELALRRRREIERWGPEHPEQKAHKDWIYARYGFGKYSDVPYTTGDRDFPEIRLSTDNSQKIKTREIDMISRTNSRALRIKKQRLTSSVNRMAIEWQAFKGPRGGTGWQDPSNPTDIRYQVEKPDQYDREKKDQGRFKDFPVGEPKPIPFESSGVLNTDLEELEYSDDTTPEMVKSVFEQYGVAPVEWGDDSLDGVYQATDGTIVEWDGEEQYFSVTDPSDLDGWIYDRDIDSGIERLEDHANDEFWYGPGPLYHATDADGEELEDILANGLEARSETRGISNRGEGSAVYTTAEWEEAMAGHYGDVIFEIDTEAMKKDGYMPYVNQEPDIVRGDVMGSLARELGDDSFHYDYEGGMSPSTFVINGSIPAKYLKRK